MRVPHLLFFRQVPPARLFTISFEDNPCDNNFVGYPFLARPLLP